MAEPLGVEYVKRADMPEKLLSYTVCCVEGCQYPVGAGLRVTVGDQPVMLVEVCSHHARSIPQSDLQQYEFRNSIDHAPSIRRLG